MHHSFKPGEQKPYYESLDLLFEPRNLQVNRTDGNFQKFVFDVSSDLNYIDVKQIEFLTQSDNVDKTWNISNYQLYKDFTGNANNSRIYQTETLSLGSQSFPMVSFFGKPQKYIYAGRNVTRKIFNIPITSLDIVNQDFSLTQVLKSVEPVESRNAFSLQSYILFDFVLKTQKFEYYEIPDIVSELGGLISIAGNIAGYFAIFGVILFIQKIAIVAKIQYKKVFFETIRQESFS